MPKIIGITGYIGSGKTLLADALCAKHNFTIVMFAFRLKDMGRAVGLREDQVEGTGKEIPCQLLCDKTPRYAMQTLGTEWGRNIIGENIWVNLWSNKVQDIPSINQH